MRTIAAAVGTVLLRRWTTAAGIFLAVVAFVGYDRFARHIPQMDARLRDPVSRFPCGEPVRFAVLVACLLVCSYLVLNLIVDAIWRSRRSPGPVRRVLAGPVTALVMLAILEVSLTVYDERYPTLCVYDPITVYKLRPGCPSVDSPDSPVPGVNSLGFRGPEVALTKQPSALRVAVVGDSALYGDKVGEGATMPAQLQLLLSRACPQRQVEVLNLAVPGWTSFQGLYQLETLGMQLQPDVLIIGFNNGPEPADKTERELSHVDSPLLPLYRLLARSHTYRTLRTFILQCTSPRDAPASPVTVRVPEPEHMEYLRRMRDLCAARGIPVLFVVMPHNTDVAGMCPSYQDLDALRGPSCIVLDLNRAWRSNGSNVALFVRDDAVHPNAAGHHRMADEMMEAMKTNEVLRTRVGLP